jgi:hypothetical protein
MQYKRKWCMQEDEKSRLMQKNATDSMVENVIVPLEQAGNTVDVILTDHDCPLTRELATWIGDSRVKLVSSQSPDLDFEQQHNLFYALGELARYSRATGTDLEEGVAIKYSHVFLLRHDTVWLKPMSEWPEADFSKVLFPYHCPNVGVHDLFTLMPASYFASYYKTIELRECFQGCDGHLCLQAMAKRAGEDSVDVAIHWRSTEEAQWSTLEGTWDYENFKYSYHLSNVSESGLRFEQTMSGGQKISGLLKPFDAGYQGMLLLPDGTEFGKIRLRTDVASKDFMKVVSNFMKAGETVWSKDTVARKAEKAFDFWFTYGRPREIC